MVTKYSTFYDGADEALESSVSYEEIMDIVNRRHDYERFGDNDIF